jgi:hypothetical protein
VDGVLGVNELVDYAKKKKKECLIFKRISRRLMIRWIEFFCST